MPESRLNLEEQQRKAGPFPVFFFTNYDGGTTVYFKEERLAMNFADLLGQASNVNHIKELF
jgi:hypothetical protein